MLPLVLEFLGPEGWAQCFLVCKSWRGEVEERGFCHRTFRVCSTLADGGDVARLGQNSQRRLDASPERAACLDANVFMQRSMGWKGTRHQWLQAASQEPDASFLSRGAASTAQSLGLRLVHWVGKPQGRYPGSYTLGGYSMTPREVAFTRDGKRVAFSSNVVDGLLLRIWNVETGAEVSIFE
jgi:hypothetical protein